MAKRKKQAKKKKRATKATVDENVILDAVTTPYREATPSEARLQCLRIAHPDLYDRARKKIGLRDDQIASYANAEALKQYCDGIHPQSNPDARIKEGAPVVHPKFADNMPDSFTLDSVQEANFVTSNREQFDQANLQSFLRNINRKYGTQKPVRIVQDTSFVVVKRELVTTFKIYFK